MDANSVAILQMIIRQPCTSHDVSEHTGIPIATCYRSIKKLEKTKMIKNSDEKRSRNTYTKIYSSNKSEFIITSTKNKVSVS